jgi:hypothetical protein
MAKVIPVVRNEAAPTRAASKPLAAIAMIAASHHDTISWLIKIHETYTPVAKYRAWPKESKPVKPKIKS